VGRVYFIFIICIILTLKSEAQDIHFSQADLSPINLNPSLTGKFDSDYRLHLNERTQWRSITTPYKTFSSSFDAALRKFPIPGYFGLGLVFNTDKAGDGDFGTNQIKLAFAYHYKFKNDTNLLISCGFNLVYNQHSINYSKFYFGNQYNGVTYDPNILNGEAFPSDNMHYFDGSFGISANYIFNKIPIEGGVAFHHLNKPKQSFLDQISVNLDRKFDIHLAATFFIDEKTAFLPTLFWFRQGKFNELNFGGLFQRKLNSIAFRSIYLGGWFRFKDAGIACFAFDYQNFRIGISYDLNFSSLKVASSGKGGLELSLRYVFGNPNKMIIPTKHICPPYI
jgi:type IX secretion system PorP/SprF family membrane protein